MGTRLGKSREETPRNGQGLIYARPAGVQGPADLFSALGAKNMQIEPRVLEDRFVRLEPVSEAHREGLRAACDADPTVWTERSPSSLGGDQVDAAWARAAHARACVDAFFYVI